MTAPEISAASPTPPTTLRKLAWLFGKLGFTAFGGPAAHIAMMEDEVVRRRGWMTRERFLDLLGATSLIPGPNSTEMAIHIGHDQAGWSGLIVAGACFIVPAVAIVTAIAWVYVRFGALPQITSVMYGIKPVIIAVVLEALWRLGRSAVKTLFLAAVAVAAVAATLVGVNELLVLAGAGVMVATLRDSVRAMAESQADWIKSMASARGFFRNAPPPPQLPPPPPIEEKTDDDEDDDEVDEAPPSPSWVEAATPIVAMVTQQIIQAVMSFGKPSTPANAENKLELADMFDWRRAAKSTKRR